MDCDFQIGEWVISPRLNSLSQNGHSVRVEPKVMQVLVCLADARDVVSKEKLMRAVWTDTFVTDDVLTRSISELRKIFADNPKNPRFIQTIPKGGYRLMLPVGDVRPRAVERKPVTPPAQPLRAGKSRLIPALTVLGLSLLLIAYAIGRYNSSAEEPKRKVLAVLPFQNLSDDPQQKFFADGLTAEMISQFGKVSSEHLAVIAWSSMLRYKHTSKPQDQIAQELGATYLLDGTVRRSGNHVRITAELEQTGARAHVWSNTYDGNLQDVLSLQSQVAREIAQEIRVQLTPEDQQRLANTSPVDGQGYEYYLKAKSESEAMPRAAEAKAEHLRSAIRLNPRFVPAYITLAMLYRSIASEGFADPEASYSASRAVLAKVLEIDPDSSEAHRESGWISWRYEWNFAEADREFRRAIDLNPNDALAREVYSLFLKSMGRFDEALAQSNRAIELSPMEPYSRANAGSLLALMKNYDAAMGQFETAVRLNPQLPYVWQRMGPALVMQGRDQEAIAALEKARDYSGGEQDKIACLGYAYGISGRESDARNILEQLNLISSRGQYVSPLHEAFVYEGLGDHKDALEWLERAYQRRDEYLVYLNVYPEFRNLHGDPRFQEILRKMGFLSQCSRRAL
ncbi:MAG TPA: winged helix-turn-helix domain-containing protein [Terriglobales bacterium]|nr:winged helix-turn-helix domain-containing protein [Terriglobales bacterium]